MIVYDGVKTDFLSSCENDSIAIEIEENILAKLGKHTPKAEFRSWENSLNYMYKLLNENEKKFKNTKLWNVGFTQEEADKIQLYELSK